MLCIESLLLRPSTDLFQLYVLYRCSLFLIDCWYFRACARPWEDGRFTQEYTFVWERHEKDSRFHDSRVIRNMLSRTVRSSKPVYRIQCLMVWCKTWIYVWTLGSVVCISVRSLAMDTRQNALDEPVDEYQIRSWSDHVRPRTLWYRQGFPADVGFQNLLLTRLVVLCIYGWPERKGVCTHCISWPLILWGNVYFVCQACCWWWLFLLGFWNLLHDFSVNMGPQSNRGVQ